MFSQPVNQKRLLISIAAFSMVITLALANTLAVNRASQNRVVELETFLFGRDEVKAKSIENLVLRSDNLAVLMARRHQPSAEWVHWLVELQEAHQEFQEDARYEYVLPHHMAMSKLYLARLLILDGDRIDAKQMIEKSIVLASSVENPTILAKAKNSLGCLIAANGEYEKAYQLFKECVAHLRDIQDCEMILAIGLRNMALIERALGRSGTEQMNEAIAIVENLPEVAEWGISKELMLDLRMILCEMHWSKGNLDRAIELATQTRESLKTELIECELPVTVDKHLLGRNRYVRAYHLVERSIEELENLKHAIPQPTNAVGETACRWQWSPLFDLTTEMVSVHMPISGTMVSEHEHQTGLVVAWNTIAFSHSAVTEIVKATYDRTQVVVVSDIEESLDEAKSTLQAAGVPLDRVRFGISDCETPWFRDQGPIISRTSTGNSIWIDSLLTRDDRRGRTVLDALPNTLRRNWRTRVVDTPIHVEGGMLLSNGRGLTVGSSSIVTLNRTYGFSDETIKRELRRINKGMNWHFVNPMLGELTEHIDLFMAFVNPNTVVVGEYEDRSEPNKALLDATASQLSRIMVDGIPLKVVRIPMPTRSGSDFPSYTNVVFANGTLLVPSYGNEEQKEKNVKEIYSYLLPEWDIRFIDCSRLRNRGGALHCLVSNLGNTPFTPMFASNPLPVTE
ncbi:MAG: agmatine deiminase family protein [Rubripirellula sp.]|nr:agmatine deiminase family protein [Rubripirellula sp.]